LKARPSVHLLKLIQHPAQTGRHGRSIPIKGKTETCANLMANGSAMRQLQTRGTINYVVSRRFHHWGHLSDQSQGDENEYLCQKRGAQDGDGKKGLDR
jgi:hypothetical protein